MELHGWIEKGELKFPPIQNQLKKQFLATLKDGTAIRETLIREGRAKSWKQVKAIFGVPVEMVRLRLYEMRVDVCGVPVNKEMVYDILKKCCFGVGDMGETLGVSEMTTLQAKQAYSNCQTWAATQLSLVIPDPDPLWAEKKKQKQSQGVKDDN